MTDPNSMGGPLPPGSWLGVLGGGQLGRMFAMAAQTLGYRVCVLDAGHLSQTLFLSATEQGLGAFITAAINEVDIERAFGLVGFVDGPLAVCGFGIRADTMTTAELDPNRQVWK